MGVVRFYADRVLIVDKDNPDRVGYTAEKMGSNYQISSSLRALTHFTIPAEYWHKKIIRWRAGLYMEKFDFTPDPTWAGFGDGYWLADSFSEGVTYNTKPETSLTGGPLINPAYQIEGYYYSNYYSTTTFTKDALLLYWRNGIEFWGNRNFWTSISQNQPVLEIDMGADEVLPFVTGSPAGGYVAKQKDASFSWSIVTQSVPTFLGWEIASQAFEWKNADDEEFTHIDTTESGYTIPANTITGGSIVWRAVVTVTDGSRTETLYTSEYTINTTEPLGYATAISPKNTIVDGSKPVTLRWRYSNDSGMTSSKTRVWWSNDNTATWTYLGEVGDGVTSLTVPADTFTPGEIAWTVIPFNQEGAQGHQMATTRFTNVAAPPTPILTSDAVPYATIRWQSEGQEAWQLTVDGVDYGTRYGYDRSFTLTEPLEDGQHTASVTVQNEFGLWSQPGALVFDILNQPGGEVMLSGEFGVDAALRWTVSPLEASPSPVSDWARGGMSSATGANQGNSRRLRTAATTGLPSNVRGIRAAEGYEFVLYCWDGNGEYLGQWTGEGFEKSAQSWTNSEFLDPVYNAGASAIRILARRTDNADITTAGGVNISYLVPVTREPEGFQVYRDGVRIGRTSAREFVDRMALGEHSWQVLARLPDGYYTRSNTVTGTVSVREPVIAAANGSGEWLRLRLSDRSTTVQDFSSERTVSLRHFAGAEYPVLEMAPFKDRSGRYDVSFLDPAEAAAFEALFGQVVILKSRRGNVIVGPLASLGKAESDFYTSFTFTIQQIHWEENADDS